MPQHRIAAIVGKRFVWLMISLLLACQGVSVSDSMPTGPENLGARPLSPAGDLWKAEPTNHFVSLGDAPPFGVQIASLHPVAASQQAWDTRMEGGEEVEPFPSLLAAYQASGAAWCRVRVPWREIEPQQGVYDWAYYDEKLSRLVDAGARLIVTVADNPDWAASTQCGPIDQAPLSALSDFLTLLVERYQGAPYYVKHWELYNEPDGTWVSGQAGGLGCWGYYGAEYAEMLSVAYPAIKAADPEAQVLIGGIAYDWFTEYGGPFYRYFIDDVLLAGGGDYFDLMNFHYFTEFRTEWDARYNYKYGRDLVAKSNYIRERLGMYGVSKPLVNTELAERGYSLSKHARYVITGYARGIAADLGIIIWYGLVTYDVYEMGLLYSDFTPKPAFFAYQTAVRELSDLTFARNVPGLGFYSEGYIFTQPDYLGKEKAVVWTHYDDYGNPTSERVSFSARQLRLVDRDGTVWYINDGGEGDQDGAIDGAVSITATVEPLIVDLDPVYGTIESDRDHVEVGETMTYTLRIVNAAETTLTARLEDPIPAPTWVTVLSDTIVGGALITGSQPMIYWEGALPPHGGMHTLSFQVQVMGYPPGWRIDNVATLVNLSAPGPAPALQLSIVTPVWGHEKCYLPVVYVRR